MKECLPFCLCNKPGALFFMVSFQSHAISFLSGGRTSGVPYKIKLMKQFFYTTLLAGLLVLPSCADDAVPAPEEAEGIEAPEAWHDKTRTQPYPKLSNELYINPSPLIVPQALKTEEKIRFALSQDSTFPEASTQLSEAVEWCMFNPHRVLEAGHWYWRYRNVSADGTEGEWSAPIEFEVKAETPVFVTPDFATFRTGVSQAEADTHPRIYCFLNDDLAEARQRVSAHDEYPALVYQADRALTMVTDEMLSDVTEGHMEDVASYVERMLQAYLLTQDKKYASKLQEIMESLCTVGDDKLFLTNFTSTAIAYSVLAPYDLFYNSLSASQIKAAQNLLWRVATRYYSEYCGMQENHIFDNHFWQRNMRVLFQIAFCLWDKSGYEEEASRMLEYYYELWTSRAPASGFNRDGAWANGSYYLSANLYTLYYMPILLSHVSGTDFLQHPWYQHAGQALAYNFPPSSKSTGFGDYTERYDSPTRQYAAFADFLAREIGDGYAGWYASQCSSDDNPNNDVYDDLELRLYRICRNSSRYDTELPSDAPKMKWYEDIGEVVMHSNLADGAENLTLGFRSSTFGSGSHTLADQNSFNLLYGGKEVYYHSGYYTSFSDAHTLTSYRHTRAHNTILVNGIGQAFTTEAYGMMLRAAGGSHIAYALGDASEAYRGISDDPMWVKNFENAGIAQTPENGFGTTPLTKYRRQVLMLYPDIVLVYDELEASEPVRWEWLLHSPVQFGIEGQTFTTRLDNGVAVARMFSDSSFEVSQTNQFAVSPGEGYANQWHLTASFENIPQCRILTLVQVRDSESEVLPVVRNGNRITCGDWAIEVNLDPSSAERLQVTSSSSTAVYSYGSDNPVLGGKVYARQYRNSSVLYDSMGGAYRTDEQTDRKPVASRRG